MLTLEHLACGLTHGGRVDRAQAAAVGAEQRALAQQVDAARHAAAAAVDRLQRAFAEGQRPLQAGDAQAVPHVVGRPRRVQGLQVHARDDALRELLEIGARQQRAQLGLADENDLQQLAFGGLEVGEQAQEFEQFGSQALRLVDDEQALLAARMAVEQEAVERIDAGLGARRRLAVQGAGVDADAELLADGLQQLQRRQQRVVEVGDAAALGHLLEEAAAHRRLAGADAAGQQHEAAAALQAVEQVCQRLAVALAQVQEARIGCDRERLPLQAEECRIHGRAA